MQKSSVVTMSIPKPAFGVPAPWFKAPVLDGRLDDAEWRDGEPFRGFVQREQNEGAPATERTEVRILTDGEALYIGAWMYDREPNAIVPGEKVSRYRFMTFYLEGSTDNFNTFFHEIVDPEWLQTNSEEARALRQAGLGFPVIMELVRTGWRRLVRRVRKGAPMLPRGPLTLMASFSASRRIWRVARPAVPAWTMRLGMLSGPREARRRPAIVTA
mgnify:CR=1 FL=1